MNTLAIYGASHEDAQFFAKALPGTRFNIKWCQPPIDPHEIADREVISVFVDTPVTAEIIKALPKLRLIACRSTGFNNVDVEAAKAQGVTVANVPSYGAATVAEYTFALLLMLTRRMSTSIAATNSGEIDRKNERGTDLFGKTIGVIGTGSIGMNVVRIAKGFGMAVLAYDIYPQPERAAEIGFTYIAAIDDLLAQSDVISLHVPYMPENHHFIAARQLALLKPGAIILNTARGELVDTPALVAALKAGKLGGAGLDVVEGEVLLGKPGGLADNSSPEAAAITALQNMPQVILTNHNAFNTREAVERINHITVENISNFFAGQPVHAV